MRTANKKLASGKKKVAILQRPVQENDYLNYNWLDGVLKVNKNKDYYALPSHSNQFILKKVFDDWDSYFASSKEYKANPSKFKGKPSIPSYAKDLKTAYFSNITCKIKGKHLSFPKTKLKLNIGKIGAWGKLKEVRVKPYRNYFQVELVMDQGSKPEQVEFESTRVIGIDFGVDNFA